MGDERAAEGELARRHLVNDGEFQEVAEFLAKFFCFPYGVRVTPRSAAVLVLASGSEGRLRLLREAGIHPEAVVSGVDETAEENLDTAALVQLLADRKASAVAARRPAALVLGCDSLLDLDGVALGKPESANQAVSMWRRLAGREGMLLTGHCLIDGASGRRVSGLARTVVRFGTPTEAELAAYVASGEPLVLAGAFSIDGRGAPFIEGIDGDPGNVIGVSLPLLRQMLADLGIAITDLWHTPTSACQRRRRLARHRRRERY